MKKNKKYLLIRTIKFTLFIIHVSIFYSILIIILYYLKLSLIIIKFFVVDRIIRIRLLLLAA